MNLLSLSVFLKQAQFAFAPPNTQYSIQLFDPNGEQILLSPITGIVASSGCISESWNGHNQDGSAYSAGSLTARFTVTAPGAFQENYDWKMKPQTPLGFGDGDLTVAYSWPVASLVGPGNPLQSCIQAVVDSTMTSGTRGRYYSMFNLDSVEYPPGNPGYLSKASDVTGLLLNLSSVQDSRANGAAHAYTRNFYWYGHGSTVELWGMPGVTISRPYVADALNNIDWPSGPVAYHPYRFVFLDCCDAGDNSAWAEAFAIPVSLSRDEIGGRTERTSAFLGWKGTVASPGSATGCQWYEQTLYFFFALWQNGFTLKDCWYACSHSGTPRKDFDPYGLMDIQFHSHPTGNGKKALA